MSALHMRFRQVCRRQLGAPGHQKATPSVCHQLPVPSSSKPYVQSLISQPFQFRQSNLVGAISSTPDDQPLAQTSAPSLPAVSPIHSLSNIENCSKNTSGSNVPAPAPSAPAAAGRQPAIDTAGGGATSGLVSWFLNLVTEQYLPLMLLSALVAAAIKPSWGLAASRTSLQTWVTFTIFVLQGLMLRKGEAEKALGSSGAILWGLASILFITPLVAPLAGALPLQPPGLALGLLVFACMPTTLSSGVALTQVLGGNTALALLLTISTNLTSVFTLPFLLPWALQASASLGGFSVHSTPGSGPVAVQLDPVPLLLQLVQCILLPSLAGAGLRGLWSDLRNWVDSNRRTLSVISGALLSLVPWMQVSKALSQGVVVAPAALAAAVGCSLLLHAGYLGLNTAAAQVLQLGGSDPRVAAPNRRALIIVASQKTLPVAMAVLGQLGLVVGAEAAGCAAVTAVFSHLAQTCVDFWLVSRWQDHIRRRDEALAPAPVPPALKECLAPPSPFSGGSNPRLGDSRGAATAPAAAG